MRYAAGMTWVEPMTVNDLLDLVARDWTDAPPESNGVYLVSLRPWRGVPTPVALGVAIDTKKPRRHIEVTCLQSLDF
ncbi:MAG: hypothetical protein QM754_16190 [Tepidisphaeraceae bacterium]